MIRGIRVARGLCPDGSPQLGRDCPATAEEVEQAPATPMPELNAPVTEMAMEDVSASEQKVQPVAKRPPTPLQPLVEDRHAQQEHTPVSV